jgi:uncharacterized protein YciI
VRGGRPLKAELYVAFLHDVPGTEIPAPVVRAQRAYRRKLVRLGQLVLAGPWADHTGGLAIFRAESEAAARIILESDPCIANGLQTYELKPWQIVHCDLTLRDEVVTSRLSAV